MSHDTLVPPGADHVYLTSAEAALVCRVSKATLERLRVQGSGPRYAKAGTGQRSKVVYKRSDLYAWLDSLTFGSTAEYSVKGRP